MLTIHCHHGKFCSFILCDICGTRIERVDDGLITIPIMGELAQGKSFPAQHVHKGRCQQIAEDRIGFGYGDLELEEHLVSLLANLGWKPTGKTWARALEKLDQFALG